MRELWNTPPRGRGLPRGGAGREAGAGCPAASSRIAVSDRSSSRARDDDEAVLDRAVRLRVAHASAGRQRPGGPLDWFVPPGKQCAFWNDYPALGWRPLTAKDRED